MWITINWADHNPPHFHVKAGEFSAAVTIKESTLLSGYLPPNKLKSLEIWVKLHREELFDNWQRAQEQKPLKKIQGL